MASNRHDRTAKRKIQPATRAAAVGTGEELIHYKSIDSLQSYAVDTGGSGESRLTEML